MWGPPINVIEFCYPKRLQFPPNWHRISTTQALLAPEYGFFCRILLVYSSIVSRTLSRIERQTAEDMPTRQAQEFITKSEMQGVEERVKRRWKTLLVLLALALKVPVEHAVRPAPAAEPIAMWAKVLLIGGDTASVAEISATLGQAGFNVITAANRQESLAKLVEANLVILDEESPDAAETCAYIREELNLPIIILGSDASGSAWDRAVSMGADAYMRRFANRSEMVARIKAILRRYHRNIDTLAEENNV